MKKIISSILLLVSLLQAIKMKIMTEVFSPYQFKEEIDSHLIEISTEIIQSIDKLLKNGTIAKIKARY